MAKTPTVIDVTYDETTGPNMSDIDIMDVNDLNADQWQYQDPKSKKKFSNFYFLDKLVISAALLYLEENEESEQKVDTLVPLSHGRVVDLSN